MQVTGFTLILDGDPDAIASVWKAVATAMTTLYREATAEMERSWIPEIGPVTAIPSPILPVRGQVEFRPPPAIPEVVVVT